MSCQYVAVYTPCQIDRISNRELKGLAKRHASALSFPPGISNRELKADGKNSGKSPEVICPCISNRELKGVFCCWRYVYPVISISNRELKGGWRTTDRGARWQQAYQIENWKSGVGNEFSASYVDDASQIENWKFILLPLHSSEMPELRISNRELKGLVH